MKRACVVIVLALLCARADAHVGSPDVFFEGDAGPYRLYVTVRMPQVIPGIATIEIRSSSEIGGITVVPMRLTGPGSEHPPTPDAAERSAEDPQFFTASLWIMEGGSLQVRVAVDGPRGPGSLAVPIPAVAQRTLEMDRGLGTLLFALMVVLAVAFVSIAAAAVREATLEPGVVSQRRTRLVTLCVGAGVVGLLAFGNAWWTREADAYASRIAQTWHLDVRTDGCVLTLANVDMQLLPDHGHDVHMFLLRTPGLDRLAHLHPARDGTGFVQRLPSLPAGRYTVLADVVHESGFPITGTATLDLPSLSCPEVTGDDSTWSGAALGADTRISALSDGVRMVWERPATLRAGDALALHFRVERAGQPVTDLEPYMGMAAHAEIVRSDIAVFAHIHPVGSVAMPALALAGNPHAGHVMGHAPLPATVSFPYGFPQAGTYRIFVQVKRARRVETGAFDAVVEPPR